jgi:hypothetical protein
MVTVTCPWCEDDVPVEPAASELRCEQCAVRVEFAPAPEPAALAA